jgi:hypothetical protein
MDRPNRDDAGHVSADSLDGDPLSLDLLIEERGDLARHPPEREIAISPHASNHIARLVQGTGQQPIRRSSPQAEKDVTHPVSLRLWY